MQSNTFLFSLVTLIRNHPWLSAIIGTTVTVQIIELVLMNRKFGLFTPSFLQPYSIESFLDRGLFFFTTIYSDVLLYGTVSLLFVAFSLVANKSRLAVSFHLFYITTAVSLMVLLAKYKVLDYMSDTINFTIAKNIAGGSLLSAIGYVADEGFIFIVFLAIAMLLYWVGHKLVVKAANSCTSPATKGGVLPFKRMASGYLFFLLGFVLLAMQVKQYDNVRYGAVKKNSYVALTSLLDMASDFDQDGYGYFSFPEDGAMFDARVYPGAVDVLGNHVDEDMLLGDFTLTDVDYELDYSRVIPQFDYVFFVVLESTRGDVLEKRVNNHIVAPNLLKLSRQGAVFPNVYSHTGFTAASLKAMFNGELTAHHHQQSIFEILQTVGYQVNVISGQAESFANISKETNMNTTATHFFDAATNIEDRVYANTSLGSLRLGEDVVVSAVNKRLDKVKGTNKQFFYINFQAAHFPYHYEGMKNLLKISPIPRSRISPANKAWLEDTYWNAVAAADHAVGQLMLKLEELGIYDQSLIVVTADHGESLFDDGVLGHGHKINDQQLKVPLVTNAKIESINNPIGQTDMRELLLDLIGYDTEMTLTKRKLADRQGVFHIIGGISSPVQISYTYHSDRLVFDFRTRKVMFESSGRWQTMDALDKQPEKLNLLRELVFEWEKINYRNSTEQQLHLLEGRLAHNH